MEAASRPHLRSVPSDAFLWPTPDGEVLSLSDATYRVRDLLDERDGLLKLTKKLARENGALGRRIQEADDPAHQPPGSEVVAVVERWRSLCHPNAKVSKDRIRLVKARLSDGFPLSAEDHLPTEPTLELAVDGIASHPYLLYGKRKRTGAESNRYDDLKDALGDAPKVEEAARAGYLARKKGWTAEGWPEEEETR